MIDSVELPTENTLRLKTAMVIYALERGLGELVRLSGNLPAKTSPELVQTILSRDDLDDEYDELELTIWPHLSTT